jgi:hypothetical protein
MSQPDWVLEMIECLPPDLRENFEERAGVIEYSGDGLSREHSECLALLCVIRKEFTALVSSYENGENNQKGANHE